MDKRRIIYYTDELNDEFSVAKITPKKIDGSYRYLNTSLFKRFTHFFWYRIIATPFAFLYVKIKFCHKTVGRRKFRECRRSGYFMYGNHTQDAGDAFIPNMINFPKTDYVIVHPNNVSMPFLGKVTPSMGAIPLPDGIEAYRRFAEAVEYHIRRRRAVVVYPEAHIWPYYTGIRNYPDVSFSYPVKTGSPVYCFTNTYQKRRFSKKPRIVTYVDGPFFPNQEKNAREQRRELRDEVYKTMCMRARNSNHIQIKYVKKELSDG